MCKAPVLLALPRATLNAGTWSPVYRRQSSSAMPRAQAKISRYYGSSLVELTSSEGGENVAPVWRCTEMLIQSPAYLASRAGEQRRSRSRRWSAFYDNLTVVRSRGNGNLQRDEIGGSLMSMAGSAARVIATFGQLTVARRHLKKAINRTLRILQITGGRLSWPLLPFASFGAGGDNSSGSSKADERSLFYQWYPIVKRRGLAFFISSAMIAMLVVSGPTNYTLHPACN